MIFGEFHSSFELDCRATCFTRKTFYLSHQPSAYTATLHMWPNGELADVKQRRSISCEDTSS
jgi:hypothetical protein